MSSVIASIRAAVAGRSLVQLERRHLDKLPLVGVALAHSDHLLLIAELSDRIDLDGYAVLRLRDITECRERFERRDFYHRALELKSLSAAAPEVELGEVKALLLSAQAKYPLVTIFREVVRPHECDIGRLKLTSEDGFAIHYLDPSARWRFDDETYRFTDVTMVKFGGEYERTLALVAGPLSN